LAFLSRKTTNAASRPSGINPSCAHLIALVSSDRRSALASAGFCAIEVVTTRMNFSGVTCAGSTFSISGRSIARSSEIFATCFGSTVSCVDSFMSSPPNAVMYWFAQLSLTICAGDHL
jgi:hypothetical protein